MTTPMTKDQFVDSAQPARVARAIEAESVAPAQPARAIEPEPTPGVTVPEEAIPLRATAGRAIVEPTKRYVSADGLRYSILSVGVFGIGMMVPPLIMGAPLTASYLLLALGMGLVAGIGTYFYLTRPASGSPRHE